MHAVLKPLVIRVAVTGIQAYQKHRKTQKVSKCNLYAVLPLVLGRRQIRVLAILPGAFDDDLKCELRIVSLDDPDAVQWHALSYRWEDGFLDKSVFDRDMTVNGYDVRYRSSLTSIIRHLRASDHERIFWIDAVCINQDSIAERTQQIRLMREIYSKARTTYIWLGKDTIMKTKTLSETENLDSSVFAQFRDSVMTRAWFTRLWVVQELVLSDRVYVVDGRLQMRWDVFVAAWKLALLTDPHPTPWESDPVREAVEILESFRQRRRRGQLPGLMQCLQAFRHKHCKDDRDLVLGILGLVDNNSSSALMSLGYHMTASEIYTLVTKEYIVTTGDLDPALYRGQQGSRKADLPSWVPDFSQRTHIGQLTRDCFPRDSQYNVFGGEYHQPQQYMQDSMLVKYEETTNANSIITTRMPVVDSFNILTVYGVHVDDISEKIILDLPIGSDASYTPPSDYHSPAEYPSGGDYASAFAYTICLGRDKHGLRTSPSPQSIESFPRALQAWEARRIHGYSLIRTKCGYIGLAPTEAHVGDLVCILYGASVPVILRETNAEHHLIIGASYVHGIMDGEAVLWGQGGKQFSIM